MLDLIPLVLLVIVFAAVFFLVAHAVLVEVGGGPLLQAFSVLLAPRDATTLAITVLLIIALLGGIAHLIG